MKTDGATGPLGRSIIYIYSSRSKNIFIKCKCMTTISSFVGRILTTENLWCSQFPSFRFFLYSDNALHWAHPMTWLFMFNLLSGPGGKKNRQKERRLMKGFLAAGGKLPPPQANPPQRWSSYFAQNPPNCFHDDRLSSGPRHHQHFRNRTTINLGEKRSRFIENIHTHV